MFSQWRSKREAKSSAIPKGSSASTSPVDSDFSRTGSARSMRMESTSGRPTGVQSFSKVTTVNEAKLRLGPRDGPGGRTPSSIGFAAIPRPSSRGDSLEFGRGVVPDDPHSGSDHSESPESPITPNRVSSSVGGSSSASASTGFPLTAKGSSHDRYGPHGRLESSDTQSSVDDFRYLLAFSSPSHTHQQSPSLTLSTTLSTPEFATAVAASGSTRSKPPSISYRDKPQPPIPTAEATADKSVAPPAAASSNRAASGQKSPRSTTRRASTKSRAASTDEPLRHGNKSSGAQRILVASKSSRSISERVSSSNDNEVLALPQGRTSTSEAMRALEESVQRGPGRALFPGLGITGAVDARRGVSSSNSGTSTAVSHTNSHGARLQTKAGDLSSRSSTDSRRRNSIGRDILQMLIDFEQVDGTHRTASTVSNKSAATRIDDGGHSPTTSDTSAALHESDQLTTIKERIEAPEIALRRQISVDLGLSPSQTAHLFDARSRGISTCSSGSDGLRAASSDFSSAGRSGRLSHLDELQETGKIGQQTYPIPSRQASMTGIASPTFGVRQRKVSQASIANELLPALSLDGSASRSHKRTSSNASSMRSRKGRPERSYDAGPRRGSDVLVSMTTPNSTQAAAKPYTAPLPSLPFSASGPTPLLQPPWAWSTAQSEPNTPHLVYQAELVNAVGKQRKHRPAALALNHAALSAFVPDGTILSSNINAFKDLASPGRFRVLPPSAPPTEPLPAVPDTPLLAPKSPTVRQRKGPGANATASNMKVVAGDESNALENVRSHRSNPSSANEMPRRASEASLITAADHSNIAAKLRVITSTESAKHDETDIQAGKSSAATVSAVSPAPQQPAAISPALGSIDEDPVKVAASAVSRLSQPVRLSLDKRHRRSQESPKTAAPAVVAAEHADGQIVTPKAKSPKLEEQGQMATIKADESSPRSSPLSLPEYTLETVQTPTLRAAAADRRYRPPPSVWNRRKDSSVAPADKRWNAAGSSELDHEYQEELRGGAESVASCHSNFSCISDRRREVSADKEALLGALSESSRQEVLRRTEGRFAGAFGEVARAFRQLQADKTLLEQIVREKTPLSGVGDNHEMLSAHLSRTNAKLEQNTLEIRKLLDLLEQQREVMEQMMATHKLEKDTLEGEVSHLHRALDQAEAEVDHSRAHVRMLNEDLARAHAAMAQASADAMHARSTLTEEARKREKVIQLLRQAKERLREDDTPVDDADLERPGPGGGGDSTESEVANLRRMLAERDQELATLRVSHADALMQHTDDTVSLGHGSEASTTPADQVTRLRTQITEQREREKQIRTAYVHVREQLRKVNSERRRSSGSVHALAVPSPSTGEGTRYLEMRLPDAEDKQLVKLKRLSLPIVARSVLSPVPGSTAHDHWSGRSASPLKPPRSPTS